MAKYPKRHFITSEASKTQVSLLSSWHHPQKTFGPFQPSITQKYHIWCYTPLCIFFQQQSNGGNFKWLFQLFNRSSRHTFRRIHQGSRARVIISNTNDAIKQSMVILTHSIPPREYCLFILKGDSKGSSKTMCQGSMLHQSTLATQFIQYSLNSSRTVFSIHTSWEIIQQSSFPNLASYTLHQTINTALSIQYRTTAILKGSSSQLFTNTSLL
ncbi:hypothetical protein O181_105604 [Austropuccinia psidii MF-1]|uniref:Uncharacterized protein n=1 Tax=Austropuccinia psidii MF-1 TaxID=1389203 RepID=A0A9Q3JPQ4_9BASI|nr:hypothetical protein [Austropuccinia psidii MF-1]